MAHGKLSPSKAHRWLVCPGSQHFEAESAESTYAEEGQHAHDILEAVLKGQMVLTGDIIGGKPAPEHRIQQAIEIRDFIEQFKTQHPDFVVEAETPVSVSKALNKSERADDFDGTADLVAWNLRELVVLDAKFGFVRVEPKDNPQLILYALGALGEIGRVFGFEFHRDFPITLVIAQPDYEGIVQFREHRMTFSEMASWIIDKSKNIEAAVRGDRLLNPNDEKACRYCPGRFTCSARQDVLIQFAQEEWRMTKTLGDLLPLLPQIRHIADDLEKQAAKMLAEGEPVPGYKLVESRSIRQWSPDRDVIRAANNAGLEITTIEILSPAKFEKKHGKKGKGFTELFAIVPKGRPKLAPVSDPREPFKQDTFTQEEIDEMLKGE